MYLDHLLAPAGSTGNNTHASVYSGGGYDAAAVQFNVTAVGGTPTVTWKAQGSLDGVNWFDIGYITDATDTISAATRVSTTVSAQISFLSNPVARAYAFFRLVTSANTNVTYNGSLYLLS